MLKNFIIEKYKGFGDEQLIELKPITLLYGENNSGKSSLARFLPSLKENYKYNDVSFYPIGMLGKANKNFIYGNSRYSHFELNYEDITIKYYFHIINDEVFINQILIKDYEGNSETINLDLDNFTYFAESNPREKFNLKNMLPLLNNSNLCRKINEKFEMISKGVFWISPLRYIPKPIEVFNNIKIFTSSDGADAIQIMASSVKGNKRIFEIVDQWIGKIFRQKIELNFSAVGDYQVFTTDISPIGFENISVPIAESGMGVSQILPILVLCAQLIAGEINQESYLIFENPELHLHDALHKELAQIFAEVINEVNSTKIIIETHSEVLLQAIQLEVIKNVINFDSVSINWVKKIEEKNIVERVNINEDGQLDENWPATAFQTSNNLAKKHVIELLARGQ